MILRFGPVDIVKTEDEHLPEFWNILKDWPGFWADRVKIRNLNEFIDWFKATAKDSLTGLDGGMVVGCGYLDSIYPGFYATVNIFKKKGYLNPRMVSAVMKKAMPYFFEKYNLEKLVGITRADNRACIRLIKRVGMKITGKLRHHALVDGKWTDYVWAEILREEL